MTEDDQVEQVENEPEEIEEIVPNSVPILKMVKGTLFELKILKKTSIRISMKIIECQLEHGLRHRDYQRYRRYCTNRCRRIRKFLNFRLGTKNTRSN